MENIFIDVGARSKDEVLEMGIYVGCVVTFKDELTDLNNKFYSGRALDNRIGGYTIAEVARKIREEKVELPFGLYVVNAVQEEIGLRGAEMIAASIKPNIALITDVCHDTTAPMYNKITSGDYTAGNGPVLTCGAAVHKKLLDLIIDSAKKRDIPFQRSASSRSTGTDTDAFAYSNGGVPSALISLPLKYMHTTVETASKKDIEHVIALMMDIGGGSVEFIVGNKDTIHWKGSFEIGGQRMLDRFHYHDPISREETDKLYQYLSQELHPLLAAIREFRPSQLVGASGTFDTLTDIYLASRQEKKRREVHRHRLPIDAFYEISDRLIQLPKKERLEIPGMIPMRVDMIVVASCLIRYILRQIDSQDMLCSTYSLKEGALAEILERVGVNSDLTVGIGE
jgi:hypothetical protein